MNERMGGNDVQNCLGSDQSNTSLAVSGAAVRSVGHYATDHKQVSASLPISLRCASTLGDSVGQCAGLSMGIAQLCPNDTTGVPIFVRLPVHVVG